MTLPRRRHPNRLSGRSFSSSHLLSGKHLRRRSAGGGRAAATCCLWIVSPKLLDLFLQAGILSLLSGFAICIVMIVGKALSLLQVYLNPRVVPQLDAVALPRQIVPPPSLLRGRGDTGGYTPPYQQNPESSPVWGLNLQVPSLGLSSYTRGGDFKRRINPADRDLYEQDRMHVLGQLVGRTSGNTKERAEQQQNNEEERYVPSDQLNQPRKCQRTAWHSKFYPVCNTFHELMLDRANGDQYGHRFQHPRSTDGVTPNSDRWRWILTPSQIPGSEEPALLVLEQLSLRGVDENDPRAYRQRQVQSIVSERYTSSPRIVSSFGYCGLHMLFEWTKSPDNVALSSSLSQRNRPYSAAEALDLAIGMAEAVADLHGFEGGAIVHGQLDLSLFRRVSLPAPTASSSTERTSIVQLTDVETADFLDWDPNQEAYCDTIALSGSVETDPALEADFLEIPVINEKTDVYELADMIFTMLTGRDASRSTMGIPNIDAQIRDRGALEGLLANLMIQIWTDTFPSIFALLKELRDIKRVS